MEATIITSLTSMGTTGIGFVFLWIVMQKYFKHMDAITDKLNAMVVETRTLQTGVGCLQTTQTLQQEYCRQHTCKADNVMSEICDIHKLLTELVTMNRKIPFGKIAVSKKYLTPEQVDEIMREQTDLPKRF